MRVLGMPLPFYKSATLLLGFGLSPYVLARLWKIRPDVIHVAFPGADGAHSVGIRWCMTKQRASVTQRPDAFIRRCWRWRPWWCLQAWQFCL